MTFFSPPSQVTQCHSSWKQKEPCFPHLCKLQTVICCPQERTRIGVPKKSVSCIPSFFWEAVWCHISGACRLTSGFVKENTQRKFGANHGLMGESRAQILTCALGRTQGVLVLARYLKSQVSKQLPHSTSKSHGIMRGASSLYPTLLLPSTIMAPIYLALRAAD